jgi:hypothetical protein
MKLKGAILVLIIILITGCSTIKVVNVEPYKRIITVHGKSKAELYILSNCWLVETFVSAESVIEFQDKETGKIIGKCILMPTSTETAFKLSKPIGLRCVISIDIKDNAARITFTPQDGQTKSEAEDLRLKWISLADKLEKYLTKETLEW